ncbi:MAG: hypothetical protein Q8O67_17965 [Deltaproteobacteria bacterium]|nr:hypothetical protein [Deltaproteobacteria bacterium]
MNGIVARPSINSVVVVAGFVRCSGSCVRNLVDDSRLSGLGEQGEGEKQHDTG